MYKHVKHQVQTQSEIPYNVENDALSPFFTEFEPGSHHCQGKNSGVHMYGLKWREISLINQSLNKNKQTVILVKSVQSISHQQIYYRLISIVYSGIQPVRIWLVRNLRPCFNLMFHMLIHAITLKNQGETRSEFPYRLYMIHIFSFTKLYRDRGQVYHANSWESSGNWKQCFVWL